MQTKSKLVPSLILTLCIMLIVMPIMGTTAFAATVHYETTATCGVAGYSLGTFNGSTACVDAAGNLHLCEANFPDPNFLAAVKTYDTDSSGVLSLAEVQAKASMDVSEKGIASMAGLQFFTALTRLQLYNNKLTELDVSNNTALYYLWCGNNNSLIWM